MSISVVLRLAPAAVASRRLAGEVEIVATGERALIGSADDLIALLNDAPPEEGTPRDAADAADGGALPQASEDVDSGAPSHHGGARTHAIEAHRA